MPLARFLPWALLTLGSFAQQGAILHVRGHVTDGVTHRDLAGVAVSAVEARHSTTTDTNGFFSLELRNGPRPGDDVRIHVEKTGYRADDLTVAVSETVTQPIQLVPRGKPSRRQPANTPSFVYVIPGVWVISGMWDFVIRHFGPAPVNNVELLFTDVDKQVNVKTMPQPIDPNYFTKTLTFPEIDPVEGVWAKQFLWTPLNPDNENYSVVETSREGRFSEVLKIVGTNRAEWQYAMRVTDGHGNTLLHCKDANFPASHDFPMNLPKCFPGYSAGKPPQRQGQIRPSASGAIRVAQQKQIPSATEALR
jgi:hypothetical protein